MNCKSKPNLMGKPILIIRKRLKSTPPSRDTKMPNKLYERWVTVLGTREM